MTDDADADSKLPAPFKRSGTFYKGRSLSTDEERTRARALIVDGTIWFGAPSEFNDPFEFSPVVARERFGDVFACAEEIEANSRLALKHFSEAYRVCCFSAAFNDRALWSHYAANHTGIFLAYDGRHPVFDDARPVRYRRARRVLDRKSQSRDEQIGAVMYSKGWSWRYEREWRIVAPHSAPTQPMRFQISPLCGVVRGMNTDSKTWALVEAWIAESGRDLDTFRAVQNPRDFAVGLLRTGQARRRRV